MRRWERNFEKTYGRKPTDAEIEASDEMARLRSLLRGDTPAAAPSAAAAEDRSPSTGAAPPAPPSAPPPAASASMPAPDASWTRGQDYHEVLRARVRSQAAVNGFAGVSQAEAHAAAESFAAWDLDRDGILSRDEFSTVLQSLAESPLDDDTLQRLFALVDRDKFAHTASRTPTRGSSTAQATTALKNRCSYRAGSSGDIDFNEWLSVFSQLAVT